MRCAAGGGAAAAAGPATAAAALIVERPISRPACTNNSLLAQQIRSQALEASFVWCGVSAAPVRAAAPFEVREAPRWRPSCRRRWEPGDSSARSPGQLPQALLFARQHSCSLSTTYSRLNWLVGAPAYPAVTHCCRRRLRSLPPPPSSAHPPPSRTRPSCQVRGLTRDVGALREALRQEEKKRERLAAAAKAAEDARAAAEAQLKQVPLLCTCCSNYARGGHNSNR